MAVAAPRALLRYLCGLEMKAVIFDIGGVVVKDHGLRDQAREALGISNAEAFWTAFNEAALPACRGEEPLAQAWMRVGQMLGISVAPELAAKLWNDDYASGIEVDQSVLQLVDELRRTLKTAVVSNTVEEHARVLRQLGVYSHFDEVVLSHEVGSTKDTDSIFNLCLERLGVRADEVVFIDDVERFRATAEGLGMEAILYTNVTALRERLAEMKLL